jgi:hypothetical protein
MVIIKINYKIVWLYTKIAGLIALPIILWILPSDYFDTGQSFCISVLFFNTKCYACGMTRAIMHIMHGNFQIAWSYNKLSFVVFPLLIMLWTKLLLKEFDISILKWF